MGDRIFEKLADSSKSSQKPIFVFAADPLASVGVQGLGQVKDPTPHYRTHPEFLQLLRDITADGHIDGLLMTPSDGERLAKGERLFDRTHVTPIVRMNAETGIWNPRYGSYRQNYSMPFQTAQIEDARYCESLVGTATACQVQLGLYSITLNNDVAADERMLNAYLSFAREVGRTPGFAHILEVFLPNVNLPGMDAEKRGRYTADSIVRTMNYLTRAQKPLFIKTAYTTKEVWSELTQFDPTLVIGALGGPRQSARATLNLAHDVVTHGGKVILFGRAVFMEDDPREICRCLRAVLDGDMGPDDAHAEYTQVLRGKQNGQRYR